MSKRKPIGRLIGASPIVDGEVRSSGVISTGEASGSIGAFDINNALRFDGSGDYLEWTPPTDGNMDKWTWSGWVKRHVTGTFTPVFGAGSGTSAPYLYFGFSATSGEVDTLRLDQVDTGSVVDIRVKSEEAFSSTDTWYHVIVSYDSLNSTAANRLKWWVNGQSVDTDETNGRVYPSSGQNTLINDSTKNIWLGRNHNSYGKVSLAEVHFLDGYAIQEDTPSITVDTFGETRNGVWHPKEVTGIDYGYNGFYLDFSQPSSTTNAFNSVLYVGDGSTSNQVTGVGFSPDLVWLKNRDAVVSHGIFDTVRGVQKRLRSDTNGNEVTQNGVMSFNADGFTLGDNTGVNTDGDDHVAWCWKAGGSNNTFNIDDVGYSTASTAGLDAGSITPTGASVNTAAGFSIIGYEGNETSGATVSHGLNQTPELIMIKTRDLASRNWYVGSSYLTSYNNYLFLDTTDDEFSSTATFNNTAPTSSVFTLGNSDGTNASSSMIAYCWHSVPGYSKFGSYIGNGSSNGPVIKTGFRPAFIMIKNTTASTTHDWHIIDNARDFANPITYRLLANEPDIESSTATAVDFLADGFQLINNSGARNASNNTYIYMAFADTSPNLGVDRTTDGTGVTLLLDGESSTIADVSSNTGSNFTNNGIVQNQNPSNVKYGTGSLEFDGLNDYATFDMPELDGDYTIEFWYKPKSLSGDHIVLDMRTATNTGYPIIFTDANGPTNYAFRFWHDSVMRIDTATVPVVDTWMHVAVVRSSGTTRMFINGTQEGVAYSDSSTFSTDTSTLGIRYTGGTFPTDAYIDDFRVTVGVARYTDSFTPPTSALSADVSGITGSDDVVLLLDGSSDTTDASGNQTISETGNVTPVTATGHPYATSSLDFDTSVTSHLKTGITNDFKFGTEPFTIEFWMKPDTLNTSASNASYSTIMENESGQTYTGSWFVVNQFNGEIYFGVNSGVSSITTSGSGISTTSWSHVAIVRGPDNTCTIYVDGVSKGSATISQNLTDTNDRTLVIGKQLSVARRYDGQLTDIRIAKGAALYPRQSPTSALTNDDTWDKPKNDFSVEGNITADDQLLDTPNLRFATWDTSTPPSGTTLSNGNLTVTHGTTLSYGNPKSTLSMTSGKYYFECRLDAATDAANYGMMVQVADTDNDWLSGFYTSSGAAWTGGTSSTYGNAMTTVGGIVGVALDADTGTTWFSVNGVWQNGATSSGIAAGTDTNYAHTGLNGPFYFAVDDASGADRGIVTTANFGQDHTFAGQKPARLTSFSDANGNGEFYYQPPSGFLALVEIEKTKVNTVQRWNGLIGNSVARRTTGGKVIEHSGIITTSEHYQYNLSIPVPRLSAATFDALLVGGGGGGGAMLYSSYRDGGAGGGAEVVTQTSQTFSGSYSITIGEAGTGQTSVSSGNPTGGDGGRTIFNGTTVKGGGGGFGHASASPWAWSKTYSPAVQGGGGSASSLGNKATGGYTHSGNYHSTTGVATSLPGNHGGGASGSPGAQPNSNPTAPGPGVSSSITGTSVEYGIGGWGGYGAGYPDHTDFGCGGRSPGTVSSSGLDGLPGAVILRVYGYIPTQSEIEGMITSGASTVSVSVASDGSDGVVTFTPSTTTTTASFTFVPA